MAVKKTKQHYQKQGKRSRDKGKRYERDCAKALLRLYPECRRLFGQARKGHDAPDLGNTPFWVECGYGSTTVVRAKLLQGLKDTALCEDPRYRNKPVLAMTCTQKGEHIVSMERSQFIELLEKMNEMEAQLWELIERG
jgi:hypothetical protein